MCQQCAWLRKLLTAEVEAAIGPWIWNAAQFVGACEAHLVGLFLPSPHVAGTLKIALKLTASIITQVGMPKKIENDCKL